MRRSRIFMTLRKQISTAAGIPQKRPEAIFSQPVARSITVATQFQSDLELLEKLAGMRQVEQVWKALRRLAPRPEPHRRGRQYLLVHHPVEQASHHPEKMIIAAWVPPG